MKYYKVISERINESLKLPYGSINSYYMKDGKRYFDLILNKITTESIIQAFNESGIISIYDTTHHTILSIEVLKSETSIFDKLEKVQPNWSKSVSVNIIKKEEVGEKSVEVESNIIYDDF